jgi:hypothetical protein
MKGIIFNITEKFIIDKFGEEKFDEIMGACILETSAPFVGPGTYPDSDLMQIIIKASERLNIEPFELVKQLGQYSFFKLAERFPDYVTPYSHPKDFLKTVDGMIHVEVKKLYTDTQLPTFDYSEPSANELIITYYSKRKLYAFMEGLINGVAEYFKHPIKQSHTIYQKDGVELADFKLIF